MQIGGKTIGSGCPVFIIAEAGVNHNGNLDLAKQLVDAACDAGADAIKFQTWVTEKLVTQDANMAEYQQRNVGEKQSQFDMLKELELSYDDFVVLKAYSDSRGICFFSTPDEEDSADFLDELGVPAFKIGSGEVTNLPFLAHIARKGRPIILSTGMSSLGEVELAVNTIEAVGNDQLALLHCTSDYPAKLADCNLKAMDTLKSAFSLPVGYSDHTLGIHVSIASVARGATIIEKHLTMDKTLPGPDHLMSLDKDEFTEMVCAIRNVEVAIGSGRKVPTMVELETKKVVQKTIVAARDLPKDKVIENCDLVLRRSSSGLPIFYIEMLVGKRLRQSIKSHEVISLGMVE